VSQHEYSRLFERNRLGVFSQTEYLSSGEWYQTAAQYGRYNNSSYAAEVFYHSRNGQYANNDAEQLAVNLRLKHQLTAKDGLFFQATFGDAEGGDLNQYYDEAWASPDLRIEEKQQPILLAGYHREWQPGSHTLFLAGYVNDTLHYTTTNQSALYLERSVLGSMPIRWVDPYWAGQDYGSDLQMFSVELQQIQRLELVHLGRHTLILGGRYQHGTVETRSDQDIHANPSLFSRGPPQFTPTEYAVELERWTLYGYDQWQLHDSFLLTAGFSYDQLTFPENFRFPPISPNEVTTDQVSPKVGLTWTPARRTTIQAAYAQGLGGASLDQSFRLEPPQIAGFIQSPRSFIPESVEGVNAAPTFEIGGVSVAQRLGQGTYLGLAGEWTRSEVSRVVGAVELIPDPRQYVESGTTEALDFAERTLIFSLNQLLGDEWSVGLRYRLSDADLDKAFPDISNATFGGGLQPEQDLDALLHRLQLFTLYNHPSGFFARADAFWTAQTNRGYDPDQPGDDFWQFNALVGYRFLQRRGEVRLGLLNITDQDYRLNPLNLTPELPRSRTFVASLMLNF
jgi:outer membrane receptor protein involved in Fe transport